MNPDDVRRAVVMGPSIGDRFKNRWMQVRYQTVSRARRFVKRLREARASVSAAIEWRRLVGDFVDWLFEVSVEGLLIGFVLWQLAGMPFQPLRSLALGVAVWLALNLWNRIYGSIKPVPQKSNSNRK